MKIAWAAVAAMLVVLVVFLVVPTWAKTYVVNVAGVGVLVYLAFYLFKALRNRS